MFKTVLVLYIYCHFVAANFVYTVDNQPILVQYIKGERFTANLVLYKVPCFKDFHPEIYLCEGKSNDCEAQKITRCNKTLTTYQIQYDAVLYSFWNKKTLEVRLLSNDGTTCHRIVDENQKFILFDMLKLNHDRTFNLSRGIDMDWGGGCSNIYSRDPETSSAKNAHKLCDRPLVSPIEPDLNGKTFAVFTCFSRCGDETLTWYQIKDGIHERIIDNSALLSADQLTLNKTIKDSDQGSSIYCGSGKSLRSDKILLKFELLTTSRTELTGDFPTTTNATDVTAGANSESAPRVLIPVLSGSVAVLILIFLLVLAFRKFSSNRKPSTPKVEGEIEENELYYATTGVSYAILDLATPSSHTTPMRDTTPYTEIIGAYKPKNQVGF